MKLKEIAVQTEDGEAKLVAIKEYISGIVKELGVKPYSSETMAEQLPDKVVTHIINNVSNQLPVSEEIQESYPDLVARVTADIELTIEGRKSSKDKAQEEKEKKEAEKTRLKKEEEDKAAQLALVQSSFTNAAKDGATVATQDFANELTELRNAMPEGIGFEEVGQGIGIRVDKDVSQETIGKAIGFLLQKEMNSSFVANQIQFWVGDLVRITVERGVFATARDASKSISDMLMSVHGKSLTPINIDAYKRMAERTPVEFRNSKADPTAYLAISNMKIPRKDEKESEADYKIRLSKFEEDRKELQAKLGSGEITKRKDIVPLVEQALVKHGLKQEKKEELSIGQHLALFFHATIGLEDLIGAHEEDKVVYTNGKSLVEVTREELEEIKAKSFAALSLALYSTKEIPFKALIRGYVEKTVKEEVTKDASGKPVYEDKVTQIKVYPRCFFEKAEAGTSDSETEESADQ